MRVGKQLETAKQICTAGNRQPKKRVKLLSLVGFCEGGVEVDERMMMIENQ
jgi:hypothetical protein